MKALFLCAMLALSCAPGAAAAADPAAKAAALAKCQGACNKLDTKSGSFPQMKAHCRNPARGYAPTDKRRIESCIKGFKLGLSIGCDFVCEAGGAPKAGTSSGAALLASVRAARDAACKGHAGQDGGATAACIDGFDQGSSTYFDTPSLWVGVDGGGGVLWPLFKFFGVLALLYRGATDPRVKHALPLPAQHSVHRIEKAVQPWLRKAGKVAALLFGEARAAVAAQLDARAAQQAAAKASGLPGGLKPFGTLAFGDADLAGSDGGSGGAMMPESADFPAPLSFDAAKAFCRAFTANDGSLRLLTAAEAAAVADPAPLRSRTLVTGGYSKTVCEEALRELPPRRCRRCWPPRAPPRTPRPRAPRSPSASRPTCSPSCCARPACSPPWPPARRTPTRATSTRGACSRSPSTCAPRWTSCARPSRRCRPAG